MPHSARRATASRLEDRDQTESKTRQRGAHLDPSILSLSALQRVNFSIQSRLRLIGDTF